MGKPQYPKGDVEKIREWEKEARKWKPDKLITRPLNEIEVLHPDKRKARAGVKVKKVVEFGWEGQD